MATLNDYLLVSGLLFTIGFAGVLLRRNIIIIFMALELVFRVSMSEPGCPITTLRY